MRTSENAVNAKFAEHPSSSASFLKSGIHKRVAGPPTSGREEIVPKLLRARAPQNIEEEQKIRKLAGSRHAPGD